MEDGGIAPQRVIRRGGPPGRLHRNGHCPPMEDAPTGRLYEMVIAHRSASSVEAARRAVCIDGHCPPMEDAPAGRLYDGGIAPQRVIRRGGPPGRLHRWSSSASKSPCPPMEDAPAGRLYEMVIAHRSASSVEAARRAVCIDGHRLHRNRLARPWKTPRQGVSTAVPWFSAPSARIAIRAYTLFR
jgi:hypothetical protein